MSKLYLLIATLMENTVLCVSHERENVHNFCLFLSEVSQFCILGTSTLGYSVTKYLIVTKVSKENKYCSR